VARIVRKGSGSWEFGSKRQSIPTTGV
jgi:hypothetical protein